MAESAFSIKEALSRGFAMAKKYLWVFVGAGVIYAVLMLVTGGLESQTGAMSVSVEEARALYPNEEDAEVFLQMLHEEGYTTPMGFLKEEFRNLQNADDLRLWPEFEMDRYEIYHFLHQYQYRLPFPRYFYYILRFGLWIVEILMGMGLIKMTIAASRDRKPELSELYSNGSRFIPYILGSLCCGLAIMGGFILLVIPGLILMIRLQMFAYLILDKRLGPIASLRRSYGITKGHWWKLFGFVWVVILVNLLGLLCLIVGLALTIPATYIALAHIYDKLENPVPGAEIVT